MDEYRSIFEKVKTEFTEKRSRFVGIAMPVSSEEDAACFIASLKKGNYNARHIAFAYRLANGVERYSDDGEPQGTAGQPILHVLQSQELQNICVAVIRYFGGILLGTGGLARAYSQSASRTLTFARFVRFRPRRILSAKMSYDWYGKVLRCVENHGGVVTDTAYAEDVVVTLQIAPESAESLMTALRDLTGGKVKVEEIGEKYAGVMEE